MIQDYLVVIPARYQSSRLPGKPLVKLSGLPMIVRTWKQCRKVVDDEQLLVATDDQRIVDVCQEYDIRVEMTSNNCLTGTDRVAEIASRYDYPTFINVQGDEPLFDPDDIQYLIDESRLYPEDIINGYCEITDEFLYRSLNIPKLVMRKDGRLLYMSRSPIPGSKDNKFIHSKRQICAYAFPREALLEFSRCKEKTDLELIEDIEILRFLEMGYEVRMLEMSDNSVPVDHLEDVEKVEKILLDMN